MVKSKELKVAIEAAKKGAKEASKYYGKNIDHKVKNDGTVVTLADHQAEKVIKSYLRSKFPGVKFVAEESGGSRKEDHFWVIDPIDGSRSFSRGIPTWCVLIAFCRNEEVILGVCYFPILGSILYAERGKGAYVDGKMASVSKINNIHKAYIAFGSPRHFKNKQILIQLIETCAATRASDTTYSFYLLATGKIDSCVDVYGYIWDLAPFKVILEEAGGKITRMDGSPWTIYGRGAIATNGKIHEQVLKVLNN